MTPTQHERTEWQDVINHPVFAGWEIKVRCRRGVVQAPDSRGVVTRSNDIIAFVGYWEHYAMILTATPGGMSKQQVQLKVLDESKDGSLPQSARRCVRVVADHDAVEVLACVVETFMATRGPQ
jgi:hypothetical protein